MIAQNRRLVGIVIAVVLLLSVLQIARQFTNEVSWSPLDFLAAAILLLGTGLSCEFVLRKVENTQEPNCHLPFYLGIVLPGLAGTSG